MKSISIKIQSSYSAICSKWGDWHKGSQPWPSPWQPFYTPLFSSYLLRLSYLVLHFSYLLTSPAEPLQSFHIYIKQTHMYTLHFTLTCADCIVDSKRRHSPSPLVLVKGSGLASCEQNMEGSVMNKSGHEVHVPGERNTTRGASCTEVFAFSLSMPLMFF